MPDGTGHTALQYNLTLLGLGLACYVAAAVIFQPPRYPGAAVSVRGNSSPRRTRCRRCGS